MNFEDLLRRAKEGEAEAIRQIHRMYRPLFIKNAMELPIWILLVLPELVT